VTAACGHIEKLGLFEDKKDRFCDQRRQKVAERPCKACREDRCQEEEKAQGVRRQERQKEKQQIGDGRLPDGAKFDVTYDAARTLWTGTLTIGGQVFTGEATAVFGLLRHLDRRYRESLHVPMTG
jgi:hypothetical protein